MIDLESLIRNSNSQNKALVYTDSIFHHVAEHYFLQVHFLTWKDKNRDCVFDYFSHFIGVNRYKRLQEHLNYCLNYLILNFPNDATLTLIDRFIESVKANIVGAENHSSYILYETNYLEVSRKVTSEGLNSLGIDAFDLYTNYNLFRIVAAGLPSFLNMLINLKAEVSMGLNAVEDSPKVIEAKRIILELNNNGFSRYLQSKNYNSRQCHKILNEIAYSEKLPYKIAFLFEVGFIKFLETEYRLNKGGLETKLRDVLSQGKNNQREIRGCLKVLSPESDEDKLKYTSHIHIPEIKRFIQQVLTNNEFGE